MEKFSEEKYIIRFKDSNEIKTIKVVDKDSCDYLIKKLEEENKQYIMIKEIANGLKRGITSLLDYEV